ncbi:helix-turn-helix domain-containing protein [Actinophytocola xanthii]|uniref:HTH cro/C1-type domain-containing protein n=1 Tax=Actinophytocola xanthii TaxID=1912961 RepID=A0A1Q8CK50_9PSEU|nr:hypothetical protein BU204_25870 [Actinophytocola xanthii]
MSGSTGISDFGRLLRTLREENCLTQEELAERSGVSIRAISDLERGRTKRPHRRSVRLLTEALRLAGGEREEFRRAIQTSGACRARPGSIALVLNDVAEAHEVRPLLELDGPWAVILVNQARLVSLSAVWRIDILCPEDPSILEIRA